MVGIATSYGLYGGGFESLQGQDIFSENRPDRHLGPSSLPFNGYRCSFPWVKRPGRELDHLPAFNAEVKSERSYISTPPICLQGVDVDSSVFFVSPTDRPKRSLHRLLYARTGCYEP